MAKKTSAKTAKPKKQKSFFAWIGFGLAAVTLAFVSTNYIYSSQNAAVLALTTGPQSFQQPTPTPLPNPATSYPKIYYLNGTVSCQKNNTAYVVNAFWKQSTPGKVNLSIYQQRTQHTQGQFIYTNNGYLGFAFSIPLSVLKVNTLAYTSLAIVQTVYVKHYNRNITIHRYAILHFPDCKKIFIKKI